MGRVKRLKEEKTMENIYTFSFQTFIDEKDIENFLVAVAGSLNDYGKPVLKAKTKKKIIGNYLHLHVIVKFIDGTKMEFKHKTPFAMEYDFVEMPLDKLAGVGGGNEADLLSSLLGGVAGTAEEEKSSSIGFKIDEDEDEKEEVKEEEEK